MIAQIGIGNVLSVAGALGIGLLGGYFGRILVGRAIKRDAGKRREQILESAQRDAAQLLREMQLQAKQEVIQRREEFDNEVQEIRRELRQTERRLEKREGSLDKKQDVLAKKEQYLETSEKNVAEKRSQLGRRETELNELIERQTSELHRISGLSREDAKNILSDSLKQEAEKDCAELINSRFAWATETAREKSREIIVESIERCAAETTGEVAVCSVELPDDDIKGRIIGREGRNIRSFEKATGVDVIVDDTPGVVVLSSFDSVRREVARLAMQKLIADGRIHPARIEEVVRKATEEIRATIKRTGEEVCYDRGFSNIAAPLKELIGQLRFRTSFGQNILQHSIEVCELAGLMAGEIGLNVKLARRCGLLHDIGKALDQELQGSHAQLGAEKAQQFGEDAAVVNAIAAHHEECEAESLYAGLVIAGDSISASRPGARRETLERYVKRLERLENLAAQHSGVQKVFAIQAGRELRVLVDCSRVNDDGAAKLSHEIASEVEEELQYPGEIMVTVIREVRFTEIAH